MRKKLFTKVLTIILTLLMLLQYVPVISASEGENTTDSGLSYTIENGEVTITGYSGTDSEVIIPDNIEDLAVTAIGDSAFQYNHDITRVTLPNMLKVIGSRAFSNAFYLEEVIIPESLETIEDWAFEGCGYLSYLYIPASVKSINELAFAECSGLTTIQVDSDNKNYYTEDGVLFDTAGSLMFYPHSKSDSQYIVPFGTTDINCYAFENNMTIREVIIPDTTWRIGDYAFAFCPNLNDVVIPNSVIHIGYDAFYNSALVNIVLPEGLDFLGERAFGCCGGLSSVTIPTTLSSISYGTFDGCTALTDVYYNGTQNQWYEISISDCNDPLNTATIHYQEDATSDFSYYTSDGEVTITKYEGYDSDVVVPDTISGYPVTTIEAGAFEALDNITSVTLPDTIRTIGDGAFQSCMNLYDVYLPDYLDYIGDWAFYDCPSITHINIPGNVSYIGKYAFAQCPSLGYVDVDDNNPYYYDIDGVLISGDSVLIVYPPQKTDQIYMVPEGISFIGPFAFYDADNLENIILPDGLISTDDHSFTDCNSLRSINFPDGLAIVGEYSFMYCDKLETAVLPDSVTTIRTRAFDGCTSLASVTIPVGLTEIQHAAFDDCNALADVYYGGTSSHWEAINIGDYNDCLLHATIHLAESVPQGLEYSVNSGKVTITGYSGSDTELVIPQTIEGCPVTSIGNEAFSYSNIESITLPDSVLSICELAFEGCSDLTHISVSDNLEYIEDYAFYNCSSLVTFSIPSGLSNLGYAVFAGCSSLENIEVSVDNSNYYSTYGVLFENSTSSLLAYPAAKTDTTYTTPTGITRIGPLAFAGANNLESVILSDSVYSTDTQSFANCHNLKSVTFGDSFRIFEDYSFINCKKLKTIVIPESTIHLSRCAFAGCTELTSVTIPVGITEIPYAAFEGCTALADVYYGGTSSQWEAITLGDDNDSLQQATIHYTCADPAGLEYVINNNEIIITGYSGSATTLTIPEIIDEYPVTTIGEGAFEGCETLTGIQLADSTQVALFTLRRSTSLTTLVIPGGITTIEAGAFKDCTNLTSVTIPQSATTIGDDAFAGCDNLTEINYNGTQEQWDAITIGSGNNAVTENEEINFKTEETTAPEAETISVYFSNNKYWENVYIYYWKTDGTITPAWPGTPMNFVEVNGYDQDIYSFVIPADVDGIVFNDGMDVSQTTDITEGITDNAGFYCVDEKNEDGKWPVESYTYIKPDNTTTEATSADTTATTAPDASIPDGLQYTISNNEVTITGYTGTLASLEIPAAIEGYPVTAIGENALAGNTTITNVILPESLTTIKTYAFYSCDNLTTINIPDSVKTLEPWAFASCNNLASVRISAGVSEIGGYVFAECKNITIEVDENNTAFYAIDSVLFNSFDELIFYPASKTDSTYQVPSGTKAIYSYAFENNNTLTNVVLPDGIERVDSYAFYNCRNLRSINLPDGLIHIGDHAFRSCGITSITIPENLEYFGSHAFSNCESLSSVTLPSSITTIPYAAFDGCSALTEVYYHGTDEQWADVYIEANNEPLRLAMVNTYPSAPDGLNYSVDAKEVTITGYTGTLTSLEIPDTIVGYPVTSIQDYAFYNCSKLIYVTIPESVTSIGSRAFSYCTALRSVTLPSKLTDLSDAFYSCTSLTSITIPDGISKIADNTFSECSKLTTVTLPASVTSITGNAFYNCAALTAVNVDSNNTSYTTVDGVLFNKAMTEIVYYPSAKTSYSYTIPSGVTTIGYGAFNYATKLAFVTIPDSVTTIGEYAFRYCTNLASVVIPENAAIAYGAFDYCENLMKISLSSSVTNIASWAFTNCTFLNEIYYTGTEEQWNSLMQNCTNTGLENINVIYVDPVPEGLEYTIEDIDVIITKYTGSETSLVIPDYIDGNPVTTIRNGAFAYCTQLTDITLPYTLIIIENRAFYGCSALKDITIPDRVYSIGDQAFASCNFLESINIPANVGYIGSTAFAECMNLDSIEVDDSNGFYYTVDNVLFDMDGTLFFYPHSKTDTTYTVPQGIMSINSFAFEYNSSLETIELADSVEFIGEYAFAFCTKLKNLTMSNNISSVGRAAFAYCSDLESINLPNTFGPISERAFEGCTALKTIYISTELSEIPVSTFSQCSAITDVYYGGTSAQWSEVTIRSNNENLQSATIHYTCYDPAGLEYTISNNEVTITGYSGSATTLTIPDTIEGLPVTTIGEGAFKDFTSLTGIYLADGTQVATFALRRNTTLTTLIIPDGITTIEAEAFKDCTNLTSVTIPESVTSIGNDAFAGCTSLTEVNYSGSKSEFESITMGSGNESLTSADIIYGKEDIPEGLSYTITDGKVTITRYDGDATELVIPATIEGYPVTELYNDAMRLCADLETVVLPEGLEHIGSRCFGDCVSLKNINIPSTVNHIGSYAFNCCKALESITIPENLHYLGTKVFAECISLKSITIPQSITTIGEAVFRNCYALTSVTMSDKVTAVDVNAFSGCDALTDVYYSGNKNEWRAITIAENNEALTNATIHYGEELPPSGKLGIGVNGGSGFKISVNDSNPRPQGTYYNNSSLTIGSKVTVTAYTLGTNSFIGWVNPSNGLVVSTNLSYTFYSSGNDFFIAMFTTELEDANMVLFMHDKNNQHWDLQYYGAEDSIQFPAVDPQSLGYRFKGWDMTEAEIQAEIAKGNDVIVNPIWEKVLTYVDVTVSGGTADGTQNDKGQFLMGEAVTVTANPAESGKKFAYWTDASGNVKSYNESYTFFLTGPLALTAVFVSESEEIDYQVLASVDNFTPGDYGTFTVTWFVPEKYEFIGGGIIAVNKDNYNESTFVHGSTDTNVWDRTGSDTLADNTFNWTGPVYSGQTWYAKCWAQYKDESGVIKTVYSDMFTAVKE